MVLERGELMEYASPLELLNDPNSLFYALCKKTGALEQLKETARGEENDKITRQAGREGGGAGLEEVARGSGEEGAGGGGGGAGGGVGGSNGAMS